MDYEKAYNKALEIAKKWYNAPNADKIPTYANRIIVEIFPELGESEDEKIRKALVRFHKSTIDVDGIKGEEIVSWLEKQGEKKPSWNEEDERIRKELLEHCKNQAEPYILTGSEYPQIQSWITWLEKQSGCFVGWEKNIADNKPALNHSVLMKNIHGIAEGEWNGKEWIQYRWSCKVKDSDVLYWMDLHELEKQGQETSWKPSKGQINALEHFVRSIGESGYASPYDNNTKLLVSLLHDLEKLEKQGEKKYTWSVEDKKRIDRICDFVWKNRKGDTDEIYQQEQDVNWLKSLKERIGE